MSEIADRLYTAGQVRRLDACAIDDRGIAGYTLMQRAGKAVFEVARARFPEAGRWLILCGAGNNAGDGYVIARLARSAGLEVMVCALKPVTDLTGDAATAAADYLNADGEVRSWPPARDAGPDLLIDAMLGTGLDRKPGGAYREAVEYANACPCPVIAVDLPSGLHADTGQVLGGAVRACLTVSFIGLKRGLFTGDGPDHCGEVVFSDLETPGDIHDTVAEYGTLIRESLLKTTLPRRARNSHKGHFGHVLVVGGAAGMSGAVRLAGEAALRSGAGLVTVATHAAHAATVNVACPELMVAAVKAARDLRPLLERATVVAVGPGLGQDEWAKALLETCLQAPQPLVLDADGLNLLAQNPRARADWVVTPHPAEAGRLLGCATGAVQADRVGQASRLAERLQAIVALKGCGTIVADSTGRYGICPLGNPGMATGGSGDVLTGVIAALLAQGLSPWVAAQAGVAAHAAAGDRVAQRQGERGMLASDISRALPLVLNA